MRKRERKCVCVEELLRKDGNCSPHMNSTCTCATLLERSHWNDGLVLLAGKHPC